MEPITFKAEGNALIRALINTDFPGLATADAPVPLASIEKHPWMWFCMSCKTGPHPTSAFKRRRSKISHSTQYSTHAGHGKIQIFTKLGWPPCVRISEMVAFLGTNFMSDIQSWDYTHADTSVLFLTPPPPTVPNPRSIPSLPRMRDSRRSQPNVLILLHQMQICNSDSPGGEYPFCCMKCRTFAGQKFTWRIENLESQAVEQ